jgi:hypothetical protein
MCLSVRDEQHWQQSRIVERFRQKAPCCGDAMRAQACSFLWSLGWPARSHSSRKSVCALRVSSSVRFCAHHFARSQNGTLIQCRWVANCFRMGWEAHAERQLQQQRARLPDAGAAAASHRVFPPMACGAPGSHAQARGPLPTPCSTITSPGSSILHANVLCSSSGVKAASSPSQGRCRRGVHHVSLPHGVVHASLRRGYRHIARAVHARVNCSHYYAMWLCRMAFKHNVTLFNVLGGPAGNHSRNLGHGRTPAFVQPTAETLTGPLSITFWARKLVPAKCGDFTTQGPSSGWFHSDALTDL